MRQFTVLAVALALMSLMPACASKSGNRLDLIEARVGELQRTSQERIDGQGTQVSALNRRLEELDTRLATLDRELKVQEAEFARMREYLERYDATWTTFTRLQSDYDNELQKLRDQQLAAATTLTESRREMDSSLRSVSTEVVTVRNDLRQRIDRTNDDIFRLREQSKEKLDDMNVALNRFGEALQEILNLQRAQFQSMTEAYSRSLSDIEPFLPEAMLSNLNTPELLVSPNPDVQEPTPQDSEQPQ